MGAMKQYAEKEAYKLFDKWILPFIVKEALIEGIDNWQEKVPGWKFDIVYALLENGGTISVAEVVNICGFERPVRFIDTKAGWVCT